MAEVWETKTVRLSEHKGTHTYLYHPCIDCGKCHWTMLVKRKPVSLRCRSCARKARKQVCMRMGNNPAWEGGHFVDKDGYVLILLSPDDFFYPMANHCGYVREHRLVMAKKLGRCLHPWEVVHHKNGINDHNTDDNLEMTTI